MDDESLANYNAWANRLWESFADIRELIKNHPELKEPELGKAMIEIFRGNWEGPKFNTGEQS